MAKHRFKDNASEELVTARGIAKTPESRANPSFDLPATATVVEITPPPDMPKPEVVETPVKIVAAKFQPERIKKTDEAVMDAGMRKLMDYLPDDARELIEEYAASRDIPFWQVIGGYVMRCRDNGEMYAPNILPDWENMIAPNAIRACGTCGDPMKPLFMGQGFCCNWCASGKGDTLGHNPDCSRSESLIG